ncbi:MAG: HD domain-containing protein [Anaerolineaceae bacterium]|nr:HD domain-containing protein [Anaerolineaceae bacterium]
MQEDSSYAGRWVARIRGKIVAQGGSPEQALRAAQFSRHKEKLEILYMPISLPRSPLLGKVRDALPDDKIHLVGGAVRDMLLERPSHDLDFAAPSGGIALARRVARALDANFMILDEERDTGRVIVIDEDDSRIYLDFTTYRSGDPSTGSGQTLEDDLRARDFTINAIAYDLRNDALIDPLNGADDIRAKIIRACSPTSLTDDPIRILRGVRLAAAFDFKIDLAARNAMKEAAHLLPNASPERQRDELFKIFEGPKPDSSIRALEMLGVFPHLLPELSAMKGCEQSPPHAYDVWEHTLKVLGHLEAILAALESGSGGDDPFLNALVSEIGKYRERFESHFTESLNMDRSVRAALFFAALFHDVEKPATKSVDEAGRIRFFDHDVQGAKVASMRGHKFNLSNDEIQRVKKIIFNHMRFHFFTMQLEKKKQEPSRKAIYRFFRDAGEAGVDLILLGLADLRGTHDHTQTMGNWNAALNIAGIFLESYWEKREETVAPPRLLDGYELMKELNLQAGRVIGQLLEAIREEQAIGNIQTREQALEFCRRWLDNDTPSAAEAAL